MIKSIIDFLEKQYGISAKILNQYEYMIHGNKIYIMTKQVKQFDKIKSVRKGILFAITIGNKIIISESVPRLLNNNS
jgi:hypothetical protein